MFSAGRTKCWSWSVYTLFANVISRQLARKEFGSIVAQWKSACSKTVGQHRRHCDVSLSKTHSSLLSTVLVQPRKTHPGITEKLLTGTQKNESNKQGKS